MSVGRFLISRDATGAFRWLLRDAGGATIAESIEGFIEHKACEASLDQLRKTCAKAEVVDLTMPATVLKAKSSKSKPAKKAAAAEAKPKKKGKR